MKKQKNKSYPMEDRALKEAARSSMGEEMLPLLGVEAPSGG